MLVSSTKHICRYKHVVCTAILYLKVSSRNYLVASDKRVRLQCNIEVKPVEACPHWRFKLDWCGLNLDQSCPHLIHIARKWIVSGSKLDWANPCTVGGLDLDRKWIIAGNEVFKWQKHSLIEAHVVENVKWSLECTRNEPIVVFTGSRRVQSQLDGIFRNKTIIGPCVGIVSADRIKVDWSSFMWSGLRCEIDVDRIWIRCGQALSLETLQKWTEIRGKSCVKLHFK